MKIELICKNCGKAFLRSRGEVNRNAKRSRNTYCSWKCGGTANCSQLKDYQGVYNISLHAGNKLDHLSRFRDLFKKAKMSGKRNNKEFSISLEDLYRQFDKQNGLCPYTGWELFLPSSTTVLPPKSPKKPSVDRIDSSKGYTPDNIQIVSLIAQYAKNDFEDQDLFEFCAAVNANTSRPK